MARRTAWGRVSHLQDVRDGDLGVPVPLERVHADVAVGGHVGVEYLRQEETSRGGVREVVAQDQLDVEGAPVVRRAGCGVFRDQGGGGARGVSNAGSVRTR